MTSNTIGKWIGALITIGLIIAGTLFAVKWFGGNASIQTAAPSAVVDQSSPEFQAALEQAWMAEYSKYDANEYCVTNKLTGKPCYDFILARGSSAGFAGAGGDSLSAASMQSLDLSYVPTALQAHQTLYDNWYDPNKMPYIAPVAFDRWVTFSTDPAVFTLQDANGVTVWKYDTTSAKGALGLLKIPAKHSLTVMLYVWQQNADHWAISGSAYTSEADGIQAWQLLNYGEFAERKPLYIENYTGDLSVAKIMTEKPVQTIP